MRTILGIRARRISTFAVPVMVLGLSTALFSTVLAVADALVFRPFRTGEANDVVVMRGLSEPGPGWTDLAWWGQARSFRSIATHRTTLAQASIAGDRRSIRTTVVSPGFLPALGVPVAAGRPFTADDFLPGPTVAALIGDRLRHEWFPNGSSCVGATIRIGSIHAVVVGALRPEVEFPRGTQIWLARESTSDGSLCVDGGCNKEWVGRLKETASVQSAQQELGRLMRTLNEVQRPKTGMRYGDRVVVETLWVALARPMRTPTLALLLGAVLMLVLGAVNVSTILLANTVQRRPELTLRVALGATPGRLMVSLGIEAALLGLVSGVLSGLATLWVFLAHQPWLVGTSPLLAGARVPVAVAVIGAALAMVLGAAAGLLPVGLAGLWRDWQPGRQSSGCSEGRRSGRIWAAMVVAQVVSAMVLIAGAGSSLLMLTGLGESSFGFDPKGLAMLKFSVETSDLATFRVKAAEVAARTRDEALTGDAGLVERAPLAESQGMLSLRVEGAMTTARYFPVDGEYFRAMGIFFLRGRAFERDERGAAIVSVTAAKRLWGEQNPVGQVLVFEGETVERRVVGLVEDVHAAPDLELKAEPQCYLSYGDPYERSAPSARVASVVVRCAAGCRPLNTRLQGAFRASGAELISITPMEDLLSGQRASMAIRARAAGIYGGLALALTMAAIYGLLTFLVARRAREMGIRMALGATGHDVRVLLFRHTLRLCSLGIVLGGLVVLPMLAVAKAWVFGLRSPGLVPCVAASAAIVAGAVAATWRPAARASRADLSRLLCE